MCHDCGSELSGSGVHCQICTRPFHVECSKKDTSSRLDGEEDPLLCCKSCIQNNLKDSSTQHVLHPCETPMISPSISLSSSGSFVSSCGELPVDVNSQRRDDPDEGIPNSSQEDKSNIDIRSDTIMGENLGDSKRKLDLHIKTSNDVQQHRHTGDASEGMKKSLASIEKGVESFEIETDPRIWMPPEPEDKEDDIECSLADSDDEDEYGDGANWGQPTSLSSSGEEHGRRYRFKEECRKAFVEVMNGRFRAFIEKVLTEAGVALSEESSESWVEIVSFLSWEAARLIKPDATEGRAMDPTSYVKVKCIASGSRSQSQVIRGLVFKKNAAHKHMPTKYKNPRLLLLQGVLGQVGGLSSFDAMEQEKDYLRSTIEMIETCQPNVVLVEKTVSRDMQESLLSKGITLVYDMKLPRLERISCCTGSQLVSSANISLQPELKKCDSFRIEKFVEEHSTSGEGGKRPIKTLMYFEGCLKPLGCTILLKGARNDELKKVKCVVQQAVFLAHHLILETSFLVDQRAVFSNPQTPGIGNEFLIGKQFPVVSAPNALGPHPSDVPFSAKFHEKSIKQGCSHHFDLYPQGNYSKRKDAMDDAFNHGKFQQPKTYPEPPESVLPANSCPQSITSLEGDTVASICLSTSMPDWSISSLSGFKERELYTDSTRVLPVSLPLTTLDHEAERNERINLEKSEFIISDVEKAESFRVCAKLTSEHCNRGIPKEAQFLVKDDIENESDLRCILVLQSSTCLSRGTTLRKQPHLSRIRYYGDSDMSLGQFLLKNLLNERKQCSACSEPPEGHIYFYTHKSGQLVILVRQLHPQFLLPGEAEGKLWTWTRCLKCEQEKGLPKSTQRVVMSGASRGLSLGKFFELGFSNRLASSRLSNCGHFLHRDCLQFFGLGSTVAMFRYFSVDIYTACMPPWVLEFNNPNGQEWLYTEAKDVLEKGNLLFMEAMNYLQNMMSTSSLLKQTANVMGPTKEFSDIEEMLKQEKSDFEALWQKAISKNGKLGQTVHQILRLNRLKHELLLQFYVWDRRLRALGLSAAVNSSACSQLNEVQKQLLDEVSGGRIEGKNALEDSDEGFEEHSCIPSSRKEPSLPHGSRQDTSDISNVDTDLDLKVENKSHSNESKIKDLTISKSEGSSNGGNVDVCSCSENSTSSLCRALHDTSLEQEPFTGPPDPSSVCNYLLSDQAIPALAETGSNVSTPDANLETEIIDRPASAEIKESVSTASVPKHSLPSDLENSKSWVWTPFSETRKAYRKDLQRGLSQKFEFLNDYTPAYLTTANQLITQEMSRLHFPVDTDDNVVSVYEDEFSSIIACALALLQEQYSSTDNNITEKDGGKDREREASTDNLPSLISDVAIAFPHWWSSISTSDLEGSHSGQSVFSDELSTSTSEGFFASDPLLSSRVLHPEIPLRVGKLPEKSKYSVVCIHGKQFYSLRRRCCPSELDYISSLSRCKKWDPQGGKSGVYFAKTLDDRFIVKQIKKTELDSFLKFAPEYFNHISHALSTGSQTCLAKILGIYQVIIRPSKGGKEVKIDLIVMENLFFGRNISRMYDLKGVLHRYASEEDGTRKVFLDQNFVDDMSISPFYVSGKTKRLLQRAIWNDTSFLTSINVMDYSLLLGVDRQHREIIFGIIDYLRQYTWDKKLETWVKASLVVSQNELPTVISPKEYKKRFRNFMSVHFLTVPEHWCSEQYSGHRKSSSEGSDESSQSNDERVEKSNE